MFKELWWMKIDKIFFSVFFRKMQGPRQHFEFGGAEKISGAATYIKFEFFRFCSINWKAYNTNFKFLTIIIYI